MAETNQDNLLIKFLPLGLDVDFSSSSSDPLRSRSLRTRVSKRGIS